MALIPTLTLVTVAQDASSTTVVDSTGDYSSTNLGGFGSPNPLEADISGIILQLYSLCAPSTTVAYRLVDITDLMDAGLELAASLFTGVTTGEVYSDAVYGIKYDILFPGTGDITFTGSSKQFTLAAADTLFASAAGFVLASDTSKVYYIDRTKTLNSSGGWVTEVLPSTGATTSYELFYEGDLKLLVDKAGDACHIEDIAIWANDGCKDDNFRDIWTRYKQKIAMRSKFTQGYIYDAHKLALNLAAYCDCTTTDSTCAC